MIAFTNDNNNCIDGNKKEELYWQARVQKSRSQILKILNNTWAVLVLARVLVRLIPKVMSSAPGIV